MCGFTKKVRHWRKQQNLQRRLAEFHFDVHAKAFILFLLRFLFLRNIPISQFFAAMPVNYGLLNPFLQGFINVFFKEKEKDVNEPLISSITEASVTFSNFIQVVIKAYRLKIIPCA